MIQTEDWAVFEATTSGIEESKGNHQHRISSTDSSTSNAAPLRVKQAKAARSKYTNDGIDEKNVTPLIAFEMFAGKSFTTKRDMASTDLSDSVSKGSSSSSSVESATITTTTSNDTSSVIHNPKGRNISLSESPLERYYRLKAEVDELASDVDAMNQAEEAEEAADAAAGGAGGAGDAGSAGATVPAAPWREMARGLASMRNELENISETPCMRHAGLSMPRLASKHEVLSSRLLSEVEHVRSRVGSSESGSKESSDVIDAKRTTTYELYDQVSLSSFSLFSLFLLSLLALSPFSVALFVMSSFSFFSFSKLIFFSCPSFLFLSFLLPFPLPFSPPFSPPFSHSLQIFKRKEYKQFVNITIR